jgi:hypothetical protein
MELTVEEKALIEIMVYLEISSEAMIMICLFLRKYNINAMLLIDAMRDLNPNEIDESKILDLAMNLKK